MVCMPSTARAIVAGIALVQAFSTADEFLPARLRQGAPPPLPALAVGGGQVVLQVAINRAGQVADVTPLVTTPPFTELMVRAVRGWQFQAAEDVVRAGGSTSTLSRESVESNVLVVGVFRPPALMGATFGEQPKQVRVAPIDMAFPEKIDIPPYPVNAFNPGAVLVEARLDVDGKVVDASAVNAAPPFDAVAVTAAREATFRPAQVRGRPVAPRVYIIFGFAQPVGRSGVPSL
jgi:outer membrane biosynthesis protein TonB